MTIVERVADPSEGLTPQSAEPVTASTGRPPKSRVIEGILYRYGLPAAWLLLAVIFSIIEPSRFASIANVKTIFGTQSVLLVLALGLTLPLAVGQFDLSFNATMATSATLIAVLNVNHGWPILPCVLVAVAVGPLVGLINGIFVEVFAVNAFIATLGVGTVVTGIGYALSNYGTVPGISQSLVDAVSTQVAGLPLSFYYALALVIALWFFFRYIPTGRNMLFVGDGPDVARLSGIRVMRLRMGAFIVCGLFGAFAGVLLAGTFGAAGDPTSTSDYLLPAFAACFLGSTTVSPGEFNAWGTTISVYFLITGVTGLQLLGLNDWIQQVFYGIALVCAVTLSALASQRRLAR
jgi:ribose transport system permease protein